MRFEVAACDLERRGADSVSNSVSAGGSETPIYVFRGERVVVDHDVALAFGAETKRINEAKARNPNKFSKAHTFKLNKAEFARLKSQVATSKQGRGGRNRPPWVYTIKGIGRLAMILDTPQALAASDRILDTFLLVQQQLAEGRTEIAIARPSDVLVEPDERETARKIRKRLLKGVTALADSVFTLEEQQAARRAATKIGDRIWNDAMERLRTKGLENEKLVADTELVLAEARKLNAEADGLDLDNLEKRIKLVERAYKMYRELEPDAVIGLMSDTASLQIGHKPDDGA